ncbi:MAG: hypothetical protein Q9218_001066 [Villophora microphyllina]
MSLDLTDLITDQVRKLGAESRTKKAIQIFGQVGVQTQAFEFAGSDAPISTRVRRSMKRRSLSGILVSLVASFGQATVTSVIQWAIGLVRWLWKTLNANVVILAILATSVIVNLVFSSNTAAEWWRDRRAGNYLARIGMGSDMVMSKAVYTQDLQDFWAPQGRSSDESQSACYLGITETGVSQAVIPSPQVSLGQLQRSRRRLGSHRHELMVALRVVNSIEREMVESEWEHWLYAESAKCGQMNTLIQKNHTESFDGDDNTELRKQYSSGNESMDWSKVRSWHSRYCGSCFREKGSLEAAQVE